MSEASNKKSLLRVDDIHVYYGSIHAIKGISFEVNEGEIVTLIGANGAGNIRAVPFPETPRGSDSKTPESQVHSKAI